MPRLTDAHMLVLGCLYDDSARTVLEVTSALALDVAVVAMLLRDLVDAGMIEPVPLN